MLAKHLSAREPIHFWELRSQNQVHWRQALLLDL